MGKRSRDSKADKRRKQKSAKWKRLRKGRIPIKCTRLDPSSSSASEPTVQLHVRPSGQIDSGGEDGNASIDSFDQWATDANERFWKGMNERQTVLDSYRDDHPVVVMSEDVPVKVFINGDASSQPSLDSITYKEYFSKQHQKEQSLGQMLRMYSDRCEQLEKTVTECESRIKKAKEEGENSCQQVRYFWRNKVLEESTRSGMILRNGLWCCST